METKLTEGLYLMDCYDLAQPQAKAWEDASNKVEDIEYRIRILKDQMKEEASRLAIAKGVQTRAWNRFANAANAAYAAKGFTIDG